MNTLSYTQKYALFVLSNKPTVNAFHNTKYGAGLFTAGIVELLRSNVAHLDEKGRIQIDRELPADMQYLEPLYNCVTELRPKKPKQVAEKYVATFLNKRMDALAEAVVQSLLEAGCLQEKESGGLFGNIGRFVVPAASTDDEVNQLRSALLKNAPPSEEETILATLLKYSKLLKKYFSPYDTSRIQCGPAKMALHKGCGSIN